MMNDHHFLPSIISKIGQYRSSLLFQPQNHIKSKRLALNRKNDWTKPNALQKVNLLLDASDVGRDSPRKNKKYHYYSRKYCLTQPAEQASTQKITLQVCNARLQVLKRKNFPSPCPLSEQSYTNGTIQPKEPRYIRQRKSIEFLNQRVRKYTSVCSSHSKSIAEMMVPVMQKQVKKQLKRQEFNIEPWNTSFYQQQSR